MTLDGRGTPKRVEGPFGVPQVETESTDGLAAQPSFRRAHELFRSVLRKRSRRETLLPLGLAAIKFWNRDKFHGSSTLKCRINPTRVPVEKKESIRWLENIQ